MKIHYIYEITLNVLHVIKHKVLDDIFGINDYWEFDNGVKLYKKHLLGAQIKRYKKNNLHEPVEEDYFLKILSKYKRGTFIDVGAAAGYYSILAKIINSKIEVLAINPNKNFVKQMNENLSLNKINNIQIKKVAISNYKGTCSINSKWGAKISNGGEITVTTLDQFIQDNKINNVFLVKMDIQGEELKALEGANNTFEIIDSWIIGTHGSEIHTQCAKFLEEKGYNIVVDEPKVQFQPDGIIVASKTVKNI